jgi:hypothetical protein
MMRILINNTDVIAVFKYGDKSATVDELKIDEERIVKLVTSEGRKYSIDDIDHFLFRGVRKNEIEMYESLNRIFF